MTSIDLPAANSHREAHQLEPGHMSARNGTKQREVPRREAAGQKPNLEKRPGEGRGLSVHIEPKPICPHTHKLFTPAQYANCDLGSPRRLRRLGRGRPPHPRPPASPGIPGIAWRPRHRLASPASPGVRRYPRAAGDSGPACHKARIVLSLRHTRTLLLALRPARTQPFWPCAPQGQFFSWPCGPQGHSRPAGRESVR